MTKAKKKGSFKFHCLNTKIESRRAYAHGDGLFVKRKLKQGESAPFIPCAKFGVIVLDAVPPLPYQGTFVQDVRDTPLLFRAAPRAEERSHLHLEEVWHDWRSDSHRLATDTGLALHVSGASIAATRQDAVLLKQWGWL